MFTPGIQQIADDLGTDAATVVGATTGYVICLGLGPLVLAPLSETFGRRSLYLVCFSVFTLTQIPTALARSVAELIVWRTISGFFGSKSDASLLKRSPCSNAERCGRLSNGEQMADFRC